MSSASISFPMLGENFVINPPTHLSVFGLNIYIYGIMIACGFLLAVAYGLKRCREFSLTQDNILDVLIVATPSAIIGARLYYCVFNPSEYFGPGKWGNLVKIWEGGLAIYGGILFAVLAIYICSRVKKISVLNLLDITSIGLTIGQCIGRWGNFFNREAYGAQTEVFCRMGLISSSGTIYVHPTFLYESLWNLAGFIILHFISKKHRKFSGQIFLTYLAWYGLGRYFIEGLRTDSLYLLNTDIRVSQLLAAVFLGAALIALLYCFRTGKGIVTAMDSKDNENDESSCADVANNTDLDDSVNESLNIPEADLNSSENESAEQVSPDN